MKRIFPTPFARAAVVTALSASLAFSPMVAAPAYADDQRAGAIAAASFFALLTAGIIASAAQENKATQADRRGNGRDRHDRDQRRREDPRKALPAQCDLKVRKGPDRGTYYARRCLKRNFDYWAYLPARCEDKVWVPRRGRNVNAYDAQCLARFGYHEAGSRPPRSARH